MSDEKLTKADRLLGREAFERVYGSRCRASDAILLVYVCRNDRGRVRLGISVSRRVGKAVLRNRWKRAIREAFRTSRQELPRTVDLVVSPRVNEPPALSDLRRSLVDVARRAARRLDHPKK